MEPEPIPTGSLSRNDLQVRSLGPCEVDSPLIDRREQFSNDDDRVLVSSRLEELNAYLGRGEAPPAFERAGARRKIYFRPQDVVAGIVSCGGLCPGINNVIRSIVLSLTYAYGVKRILGFRYGYAGVAGAPEIGPPVELDTKLVEPIHRLGGSVLGSSRGHQEVDDMVDNLDRLGVRILFTIGGDGTLRGASVIADEIRRRGLDIAVIGIPKTIDNDIACIERSFGFATAVDEARQAIVGAHAEARGAWNGIGLVKLMGRHSGFITAHASLANSDVNFCLVPEVPFALEGKGGFLDALEQRLKARRHAVVVVAEGAAQDILQKPAHAAYDLSGNLKLQDVGPFLKGAMAEHLTRRGVAHTIKYIDPSYIVRSMPANSMDAEYCLRLGQHAVHAGMAGRIDMVVGHWNRHFTHVPIDLAVSRRKQLDPEGGVWQRVLEATGQPATMLPG